MREKWKALAKRERRLFAAALVFLALAVLLRFVPGLRFSVLLCLCAAAVLFVLFVLERAARRGSLQSRSGLRSESGTASPSPPSRSGPQPKS